MSIFFLYMQTRLSYYPTYPALPYLTSLTSISYPELDTWHHLSIHLYHSLTSSPPRLQRILLIYTCCPTALVYRHMYMY